MPGPIFPFSGSGPVGSGGALGREWAEGAWRGSTARASDCPPSASDLPDGACQECPPRRLSSERSGKSDDQEYFARIGNLNALRRRAPHAWPRPRDITSQTRTPAGPGAAVTAHLVKTPRKPRTVMPTAMRVSTSRRMGCLHACCGLGERHSYDILPQQIHRNTKQNQILH